jgi:hypothetical protein
MSLSDLAAIGSFVSGAAVVITLMFLILQLRQGTRATSASAMGTWLGDYNNMLLRMSSDSEFADMCRRGLTDFTQLKLNDQMRFHTLFSMININAIYLFNQRNAGALDPHLADQILGFAAAMLKMKGGQQWRDLLRWNHAPLEFNTYMDGLVETAVGAHEIMPWFAADGIAGKPAENR